MGNIDALGIQELSFGEQRAAVGGGPREARKIGRAIGAFAGWGWQFLTGLDDWAQDLAQGYWEGFEAELMFET